MFETPKTPQVIKDMQNYKERQAKRNHLVKASNDTKAQGSLARYDCGLMFQQVQRGLELESNNNSFSHWSIKKDKDNRKKQALCTKPSNKCKTTANANYFQHSVKTTCTKFKSIDNKMSF